MADMPVSTTGRAGPRPNPRLVQFGAVVMLGCMAFFFADLVEDLMEDAGTIRQVTAWHVLHIFLEALSVLGLGFAGAILFGRVRFLRGEAMRRSETISLLRGRFGEVLEEKFDQWSLTPAERDIAILILKGATVADIAAVRRTAPGTVKSQSSALFRKVGVRSRNELSAFFLDEFLDVTQ